MEVLAQQLRTHPELPNISHSVAKVPANSIQLGHKIGQRLQVPMKEHEPVLPTQPHNTVHWLLLVQNAGLVVLGGGAVGVAHANAGVLDQVLLLVEGVGPA